METDRRTVLAAGAGLTTMLASGAQAAEPPHEPARGPSGIMEVVHIYAGADGVSHVNRVRVMGSPKTLPIDSVIASSIAQGVEDWHKAPAKTFTINVVGDIEAGQDRQGRPRLSGGSRRKGPRHPPADAGGQPVHPHEAGLRFPRMGQRAGDEGERLALVERRAGFAQQRAERPTLDHPAERGALDQHAEQHRRERRREQQVVRRPGR